MMNRGDDQLVIDGTVSAPKRQDHTRISAPITGLVGQISDNFAGSYYHDQKISLGSNSLFIFTTQVTATKRFSIFDSVLGHLSLS